MDNSNSKEYLDKILIQVIENLKRTAFAPSVQMTDVPREPMVDGMDDEADAVLDDLDEDENKDKRFTKRRFDQYVEKSGELSESEDEDEAAANGVRRQKDRVKRTANINYHHLGLEYDQDSGVFTPRADSSIADEEAPEVSGDKMEGIEDATTQDKAASDSSSRLESRDGADDMLADEPNGSPAGADGADEEAEEDEKAEESTETGFPDPIGADPDTTMEDVPMEGVETETAAASDTRQPSLRPQTPETPAAVRLPSVSPAAPAAPAEETIQTDRRSDKAITPRAVTPSAPAPAAPPTEEDSTPAAAAAPERAVTPAA
jgi:histone deacetylase 1/2